MHYEQNITDIEMYRCVILMLYKFSFHVAVYALVPAHVLVLVYVLVLVHVRKSFLCLSEQ